MEKIQGNVWKFGDNIDTDIIIPARYLVLPLHEMKQYAMAPIDTHFSTNVSPGDVIVAGKNFGCGSSREQAPAVLKALGIKAVVAVGFARIFFRNAINLGIPLMECPELYEHVQNGDALEIDCVQGGVTTMANERRFSTTKLPDFLLDVIKAGGLSAHVAALKTSRSLVRGVSCFVVSGGLTWPL